VNIGSWIFFTDTLLEQVDFLETILEETSDDLQSDSDRSGTTYWLGSDSETESVIHIRARQRAGENKRGRTLIFNHADNASVVNAIV